MSTIPIFLPPDNPALGARPDLAPAMVRLGNFRRIVNFRSVDGYLTARNGRAKIGSTANPLGAGAYCAGAFMEVAGATEYVILVYYVPGAGTGAVYRFNQSTGAWTELSATSGQYGNTRWADGAPGAGFCTTVVRDPRNGKEYILIGSGETSGSGYFRVWNPVAGSFAAHEPITPPAASGSYASKPTFPAYFVVSNHANWTFTNSSAQFTGANIGGSSTTDNYITLTKSTTAATDPTSKLTYGSTINLSSARQLVMLFEAGNMPNWWDMCKVEISEDDSTYHVVWDPTNDVYGKEIVSCDGGGAKQVVAFPLDHIASGSRDAVKYIRFTYKIAAAPSASQVCKIYMIAASGQAPGERYHAVTYLNGASRAESEPMHVMAVTPELVKNCGGGSLSNLRIPWDRRLYYSYSIGYLNTSTSERDKGVDTLMVYANDVGDPNRYYYLGTQTLATYGGGSWSFSSGSANSLLTYTDNAASSSRNLSAYAPPPGTLPIPAKAWCCATANKRLIVGTGNGSGTISEPTHGRLWMSESGNPFRFRLYAVPGDEASAFSDEMQGEYPFAMDTLSSSVPGSSVIYTLTNRGVRRNYGILTSQLGRSSLISTKGSPYKHTLVRHREDLYYIDSEKKVQRIRNDTVECISTRAIETELSTLIGSPFQACGWVKNDVVSFAIDTVQTSNLANIRKTKAWCYQTQNLQRELSDGWVMDDWAGSQTVEFAVVASGKIVAARADLYVDELEQAGATQDDGSAFTQILETGDIRAPGGFGAALCFNQFRVWADDSSGTVVATVTYQPDGSVAASAATSLDGSSAYIWRKVEPVLVSGAGRGIAATVEFVFAMAGGKRVLGIDGEGDDGMEPIDGEAA